MARLLALLLFLPWLMAQAGELPKAQNFQLDAKQLQPQQLLLVLASRHDCSYCSLIRNDFLYPMSQNPGYQKKLIIRELKIDENKKIIDFDGRPVAVKELARRYNASLTPTLMFLDKTGKQLTKNHVGITTPEFFGFYLDQSIEAALEHLAIQ